MVLFIDKGGEGMEKEFIDIIQRVDITNLDEYIELLTRIKKESEQLLKTAEQIQAFELDIKIRQ